MSAALERVIAEQQAHLDHLKRVIESDNKQLQYQYKKEQELYKLLDGIVDMKIRCATEEHHKTWFDYRQKIRLYMLEHGWCFNCGSFSCECNDDR